MKPNQVINSQSLAKRNKAKGWVQVTVWIPQNKRPVLMELAAIIRRETSEPSESGSPHG